MEQSVSSPDNPRASERQLDLMWKSLLAESPSFRSRLLEHLKLPDFMGSHGGAFLDARVSVRQDDGETDVHVRYMDSNGRELHVLIEDKFDADFQIRQGERYLERANALRASGAEVQTILAAPVEFLSVLNPEARFFDHHLSIEEVLTWLDTDLNVTEVALVRIGLDRIRNRQPLGTKGLHPSLHEGIAEECASRANGLRITNKPTDWIFLKHSSYQPGVEMRYRIMDNKTELAFTSDFRGNLPTLELSSKALFEVVHSGNTTHVRNKAPAVSDNARSGNPSNSDIATIVDSLEELLNWWVSAGVALAASAAAN